MSHQLTDNRREQFLLAGLDNWEDKDLMGSIFIRR